MNIKRDLQTNCEKKAWAKPNVAKLGTLGKVAGVPGGVVNNGLDTNRIS